LAPAPTCDHTPQEDLESRVAVLEKALCSLAELMEMLLMPLHQDALPTRAVPKEETQRGHEWDDYSTLWIALKTPPTHLMIEPPNNAFSTIPGMPILSPLGEEGFLGKALVPDTGQGSPIFPTAEQPANLDNSNLRSQPGDEATIGPTHTNEASTLHNKTNGATAGDTSGAIDTTSPYKGNLGKAAIGPTHTNEASTLGNETNVATGGDTSFFFFFGSSFYIATVSTTCTALVVIHLA
jgi:hypothetical protein